MFFLLSEAFGVLGAGQNELGRVECGFRHFCAGQVVVALAFVLPTP